MIKINVITNNINWLRFIKNPINYIDKKISKLNAKDKTFAKKKFTALYYFLEMMKLKI